MDEAWFARPKPLKKKLRKEPCNKLKKRKWGLKAS